MSISIDSLSIRSIPRHAFVADFPYFQRLIFGLLIFVVSRSLGTSGTRWLNVFPLFHFLCLNQFLLQRHQLIFK